MGSKVQISLTLMFLLVEDFISVFVSNARGRKINQNFGTICYTEFCLKFSKKEPNFQAQLKISMLKSQNST